MARGELAHDLVGWVGDVQPDHVAPRHHDGAHVVRADGQHAFDHRAFLRRERRFLADAVHQRYHFVSLLRHVAATAGAQQPQHRLRGALAPSQGVRALGAVAARQLVAQLDEDREPIAAYR